MTNVIGLVKDKLLQVCLPSDVFMLVFTIISQIVMSFLGPYVENMDKKNLAVGVSSGA